MSKIKLFCFPYAGGSATIFSKWKSYLNVNSDIELIPVELAGRGIRMRESLYAGLPEAIEDLYQIVNGDITNNPYAFFGHSLGGLLAYELARKIKKLNIRQPSHLFFSGRSAPGIDRENKNYHLMDDEEFKKSVIELGGTPSEFFEHPELLEIFLPMLKNDFKLAETNLSEHEIDAVDVFDCDISVFLGKEDYEISSEKATGWNRQTKGICSIHYFNGDHFFLHDEVAGIIGLINHALRKQREKNSKNEKVGIHSI